MPTGKQFLTQYRVSGITGKSNSLTPYSGKKSAKSFLHFGGKFVFLYCHGAKGAIPEIFDSNPLIRRKVASTAARFIRGFLTKAIFLVCRTWQITWW
jgi:hypothetical protein